MSENTEIEVGNSAEPTAPCSQFGELPFADQVEAAIEEMEKEGARLISESARMARLNLETAMIGLEGQATGINQTCRNLRRWLFVDAAGAQSDRNEVERCPACQSRYTILPQGSVRKFCGFCGYEWTPGDGVERSGSANAEVTHARNER